MTKVSYKEAKQKKAVRDFLFSHYKKSKIIGLAGPDINEYVEWCKLNGFEIEEIWEEDPTVMMKQLTDIKGDTMFKYRFGNINDTIPDKDKTVYDLDYCGAIQSLKSAVIKFKRNAVMTFSVRGVGVEETISTFFKHRKEKVLSRTNKIKPIKHISIQTNIGKYVVAPYFDTTPMISIAQIS
jgi:hypothetical protein